MGLIEQHKAERKTRILSTARRLIAQKGYEGLTMRELARASRVSVPTLYNLFGGKQALLLGELEETFTAVAASSARAAGEGVVERAVAACETGNDALLSMPDYSRELVHIFLVAGETKSIRRQNEARYVELMGDVLRDAQATGEIADWVDPVLLARRLFAHYIHVLIQWAQGDFDTAELRRATRHGMCLMLLGVARGDAAHALELRVRQCQQASKSSRTASARRGG